MKRINHQHRMVRWFAFLGLSFVLGYGGRVNMAQAQFTSVKKITVGASVTLAPAEPLPLQILHEPLTRVSPVTKLAVIQGQAGTNPQNLNPDFPSRITPFSPGGAAQGDVIEALLRFRPIQANGEVGETVSVGPLRGSDPMPFAFQVDPNQLSTPEFQYQLEVRKVRVTVDSEEVLSTVVFPTFPNVDPSDAWVTVGVTASAQNVVGTSGGRVALLDGNPNDGMSSLDIPAGLFPIQSGISIVEIPMQAIPPLGPGMVGPLAAYDVSTEFTFNGRVRLNLLYPDFVNPNGQIGLGQDSVLDGTNEPEDSATIVWWDGFQWRRIGGKVNTETNTISSFVGHLSLFAVVSAVPIAPSETRPMERVITPNGDGINDVATFAFGAVSETVTVEIFDVSGHRIRSLTSSATFEWDGRDDSGGIVESGVYIYQYKLGGERISGLIAVAK